jgi:surface polysaccharide O-acyltransferase-like enzyme
MYLTYGEGMRVLAVAAVALLHAAAPGVVHYDALGPRQWWTANAIDACSRWAVPVFLMLSGALALDPARREGLSAFYGRRLGRIGVPLVVWTVFYFLWAAMYLGEPVTAASMGGSLLAGLVDNHLYFLFVVLGLYAVAPFLRHTMARIPSRAGWGLAALLLGLAAAGILQDHWPANAFTLFAPYVGYFVVGFLLRDLVMTPVRLGVAAVAFPVASAVITIGTGLRFARWGASDHRSLGLYEYTGGAVILQSIAAFLLIRWLCSRLAARGSSPWIRRLGGAAFGIYLAHRAILDVAAGWTGDWYTRATGPTIVLHALLAFVGAAALTMLIQRVPYLRRAVG